MKKKTLVIGASEKVDRYANKAIRMLLAHDHPVVAIGNRKGEVEGVSFDKIKEDFKEVDTVTLYLSARYQPEYYDYLMQTIQPKRIIFNPGTENPELQSLAENMGISCEIACTLVLLSTGQY